MTVEVRAEHVSLGGSVEVRNLIPVIERLCRSVHGVASVAEHVAYRADSSGVPPPAREGSAGPGSERRTAAGCSCSRP
ncbi:BON domain-containing protein [Streptomyces dysideae]|uniref:BON domain-containing protein n=1 Tax=Streptomyces dysideae TaxID=909626 RepID=UPI000D16E3E9|nr:BON domain-containing protein [Streptomyces dysideae]